MANITDFINSTDPLTKEIVAELIAYKEEDDRIDYKQTLDISSEKQWLSLTKDISAFANTIGGYLLFGIDNTNNIIGLSRETANAIKDASKLQQKLNRHLDPHLTSLRAKEFRFDSNIVVAIYIPQSRGVTHLISKLGRYKLPSEDEKTVLNQGTFYVRRTAGNHLGDSRDLDAVIERRIDSFRESLIQKVARVVNSPEGSDVFILSKDPSDRTGQKFIIEDSPEAIPIKGMSFTVPPDGDEEEIAAWSVIYKGDPELRPPPIEAWKWYSRRNKLQLSKAQKLTLFKFSLWDNVPAFYWIQGLKNRDIRGALFETIRGRPAGVEARYMLITAAFLGKNQYKQALKLLGTYSDKLAPAMKSYPEQGPRKAFGSFPKPKKQTMTQLKSEKTKTINEIATKSVDEHKQPGRMNTWTALNIDCFIYAQDDEYK